MDIQSLMKVDLQQMFLDWGTTAQLQETMLQFNPLTGVMEEQCFSHPIQIIPQAESVEGIPVASATIDLVKRWVLLRQSDVPTDFNVQTARLTLNQEAYEIGSVQDSRFPGLLLLECLRKEVPE